MDHKIDVTNKLQCTTCGKQYSRKQSLDKHVQCHLPEKQWVCEYDGCGQKFKLKEYLKSHQKVHTRLLIGGNMGAASVAVELDSFGDAIQHQAVGGQGQGQGGEVYMYSTFHCNTCGKGVPTQEALRDHELTHLPGKQWIRDFEGCERGFVLKEDLRWHQKLYIYIL
jgi:ribosomal protein S26